MAQFNTDIDGLRVPPDPQGDTAQRMRRLEERVQRFFQSYVQEWSENPGWGKRIPQLEQTVAVLWELHHRGCSSKRGKQWEESFAEVHAELFPPARQTEPEVQQEVSALSERLGALEGALEDVLTYLQRQPQQEQRPSQEGPPKEPLEPTTPEGPIKIHSRGVRGQEATTETAKAEEPPKQNTGKQKKKEKDS